MNGRSSQPLDSLPPLSDALQGLGLSHVPTNLDANTSGSIAAKANPNVGPLSNLLDPALGTLESLPLLGSIIQSLGLEGLLTSLNLHTVLPGANSAVGQSVSPSNLSNVTMEDVTSNLDTGNAATMLTLLSALGNGQISDNDLVALLQANPDLLSTFQSLSALSSTASPLIPPVQQVTGNTQNPPIVPPSVLPGSAVSSPVTTSDSTSASALLESALLARLAQIQSLTGNLALTQPQFKDQLNPSQNSTMASSNVTEPNFGLDPAKLASQSALPNRDPVFTSTPSSIPSSISSRADPLPELTEASVIGKLEQYLDLDGSDSVLSIPTIEEVLTSLIETIPSTSAPALPTSLSILPTTVSSLPVNPSTMTPNSDPAIASALSSDLPSLPTPTVNPT